MSSSGIAAGIEDLQIRWFDHWLKGIDNGIATEPPVRIFVMGDNRWRDEHEWPLARTVWTDYYLHSGGRANTASGDGTLDTTAPTDEPADVFLNDPRHPVPTVGATASASSRSTDPATRPASRRGRTCWPTRRRS